MKSLLIAPALAFALLGTAIGAEPIRIEVPTNIEPAKSQLTRAEVIADLHVWRLAGLAELNRGEQSPDTDSYEYRRAYATYAHLRSSSQFAALVDHLRSDPFARVVASRPGDRVARAAN